MLHVITRSTKLHTWQKFLYTPWLEMTVKGKYTAVLHDLLMWCGWQKYKNDART